MLYTQEYIDKLKATVNLVELIQEELDEIGIVLKKEGEMWSSFCPKKEAHKSGDRTPSFRVWSDDRGWACMGCHAGKKGIDGNVGSDSIAFIMWHKKLSFTEAVGYLAQKYGIPLPDSKHDKDYKKKKVLALTCHQSLKGEPYEYLVGRGMTDESIRDYMIGWDGQKIVFPLHDRYNNVLGFTRRWLHMPEECKDKYRNSSGSSIFKKKFYLYNVNHIDREYPYIFVTEGPMDAILPTQYGAKNILATLGTAFTEEHSMILKKFNKTIVLIFDGDDAGRRAIRKTIELLLLQGVTNIRVLALPEGMDLCDMTIAKGDGIRSYLEDNSVSYSYYSIQNLLSQYDTKVTELKMDILPQIQALLQESPNRLEAEIVKADVLKHMNFKL
jgi:DNA primase